MKKKFIRAMSAAALILPVVVLSCVCAIVQLLLAEIPSAAVAGGIAAVAWLIWVGGLVFAIVKKQPICVFILALLLLCSLALFAVSYAMDYGLFSMRNTLWTLGRLCGSPMYVLTDGIERIAGLQNGAAAILAALAYLLPCIIGTAYAAKRA